MKDQNIEQLADEALNSLNHLQQVEANEFLAAKAWQRMQSYKRSMPPAYNKIWLRLTVVLLLFTGINCVSYYILSKKNTNNTSTTTGVDAFADAYGLSNKLNNY